MLSSDRIDLPPESREAASPSGRFVLSVSTPDAWKSKTATAELVEVDGDERRVVWTRKLPHEYGPRFTLVTDEGTVILLDEWINVASSRAITVIHPSGIHPSGIHPSGIHPSGNVIAQHAFAAIPEVLWIPGRELVAAARHGLWMTNPPTLGDDGKSVRAESGGRTLVIDAADGSLRAE